MEMGITTEVGLCREFSVPSTLDISTNLNEIFNVSDAS